MTVVRGFDFPDELHYLIEHDTWAREDNDGVLTIGLTNLGGHISGEFLEFMPKPIGMMIEFDRAFGMLEMSKTLRSARAPATGNIAAVNEKVRNDPLLVNRDPYGDGWLIRLTPSRWAMDKTRLVTGSGIADAVERYMTLHLVAEFGEALPPA